ncbi:hypothetical protein ACFOHS_20385 [Jhaorihella thermophila]
MVFSFLTNEAQATGEAEQGSNQRRHPERTTQHQDEADEIKPAEA